jgi:hypothetical protein
LGNSGHFDLPFLYLRGGDRQIRISGTTDDKDKGGGVAVVAVSAIVFLPAGFFMTGTSARLPAGTIIKGFLDEDVPVMIAGGSAPVQTPLMASGPVAIAAAKTRTEHAVALVAATAK